MALGIDIVGTILKTLREEGALEPIAIVTENPVDTQVAESTKVDHPAYYPVVKAGRCSNGYEGGRGQVVHLVYDAINKFGEVNGSALCGTAPQGRSIGWSVVGDKLQAASEYQQVTCEKCLKRFDLVMG